MAPSQTQSPTTRTQTASIPPVTTNTVNPDFTDPSFDPVDFLNDVLPPLTLASSHTQPQPQISRGGAPNTNINLADLSTRVQSILSQTNAQNIRHSTALNQLTDEILRSGNRLAYEVEVLRGETIGLSDTLTDRLREDIARFDVSDVDAANPDTETATTGKEVDTNTNTNTDANEPEYITKLRTLNQVRSHLEDVVQTFGDAMEWPLPPSETSLASSFISVSAPEVGPDGHSLEEKGQEVARKLRAEVAGLLDEQPGAVGVENATRRVEALRVLATVWKGTAEEKARNRFVDGLAKMVEDRRRVLEAQDSSQQAYSSSSSSARGQVGGHRRQESEGPGGGIFRNLQRLREEIYLE